MKRGLDLLLCICLAPFVLPVVALCALLIARQTPGPALFRQQRIGRNGRPFELIKLRTMYIGTGEQASHETSGASVTPIGAWLRKVKLDELPQIWCVLRGDMSFVGPRPCLPAQARLIEERQRHGVFAARPGITGLAQISGVDMSEPERLAEIDGQYVRQQSFARDLRILASTLFGKGAGDAVSTGRRQPG